MKKTIIMAALTIVMAVQAKVLRVNNVAGMAPYQQINDAVKAASNGDTIMVDGSTELYSDATINKRLVVIGPGWLMYENNIASATQQSASIKGIVIEKEGCTIDGICLDGTGCMVEIKAPRTVIRRCLFWGESSGIFIAGGANNCVIHQNFIADYGIAGDYYDSSFNHQITNNIFWKNCSVTAVHNSYIAYNTFINNEELSCYDLNSCTIEKNIAFGWENSQWKPNSTYSDNYLFAKGAFLDSDENYPETDKLIQQMTNKLPAAAKGHGAFAGDNPYVISGIPAGPVIEALTVPVSVEESSPLNVTIKLGLQQ